MRRNYHPAFKAAVYNNDCPEYILRELPRASKHRLQHTPPPEYFTGDIDSFNTYNRVLSATKISRTAMVTCARIILTFKKIIDASSLAHSVVHNCKELLLRTISAAPKKSRKWVRNVFNISRATFYNWRFVCDCSPINSCLKLNPKQLTSSEVMAMEKLATDPGKKHWSIASLCLYARNNNIAMACVATWRKYNKVFKWRVYKKCRRAKNYIPINATKPNQFWHADISYFFLSDNSKAFIYLVMDSFSRKPLAWTVSSKICGNVYIDLLKSALDEIRCNNPDKKYRLITDGGPENRNKELLDFEEGHNIIHLIAKTDITQSNSMIEAQFRIAKHSFLYKHDIHTVKQLAGKLDFFFSDAAENKPLDCLNGLTPNQAYYNCIPENNDLKERVKIARQNRIKHNKVNQCGIC